MTSARPFIRSGAFVLAAMINFLFIANAVWSTQEALDAIEGAYQYGLKPDAEPAGTGCPAPLFGVGFFALGLAVAKFVH